MITTLVSRFPYLRKFSIRNETDRLLMVSVFFSTLLLCLRIFHTHSAYYIFLEWNLFLALVPYLVSHYVWRHPALVKRPLWLVLLSCVWLLFIPNSFYILTDLFHLGESPHAPLWFDLLLILSFAWNGLVMGILSVRQMEKVFQVVFHSKQQMYFLYPVMWLNALGVYIGRYLRFNSWDIITSPFSLVSDILALIMHPVINKNAFAMVTTYSIFMTLLYLSICKMSKRI